MMNLKVFKYFFVFSFFIFLPTLGFGYPEISFPSSKEEVDHFKSILLEEVYPEGAPEEALEVTVRDRNLLVKSKQPFKNTEGKWTSVYEEDGLKLLNRKINQSLKIWESEK